MLTLSDINAVADIITIFSALFIYVKWKDSNPKIAWSFVLFGAAHLAGAATNVFLPPGDVYYSTRILINTSSTLFLVYGISGMIKGSRPLFYSCLLYLLLLPAYLIDPDVSNMFQSVALINNVIATAFFACLFVLKDSTLKAVSLVGLLSRFIGGVMVIIDVHTGVTQAYFIPKLLLALTVLGLAHISEHKPEHITLVGKKRRHK